MNAKYIALVAVGGAVGSVLRYLCGMVYNGAYPWGTLLVNILGCFAMGLLAGYGAFGGSLPEPWRVLLMVGILGGLTTFSAFSLDTITLINRGDYAPALLYIGVSVGMSLLAVFLGLWLVRMITT